MSPSHPIQLTPAAAVALASSDERTVTALCCVERLDSVEYADVPQFCVVSAEEEGRSTLRLFALAAGSYTVKLHLSRVVAVRATERCVVVGMEEGITGPLRGSPESPL